MVLPNLIIGGASKSGTSSLHFWLEAHPETHGSRRKDSFFLADDILRFNENLSYLRDGLEGYQKLFKKSLAKKSKIVFESTATYLYYHDIIKVIAEMPSRPKVIFILREPAGRLYSKYKFNAYKLKNFKGTFEEYASLGGDLPSGPHFSEGCYITYLKQWVEVLGSERIGLFIFEDMMKDRKDFMKKICGFLKIDPGFYDDFDFFQRNETVAIKSVGLHRLGLKLQPYVPTKVQEALIPFYMKLNSDKARSQNLNEKDLVEKLKKLYRPCNQRLIREFPDLELEGWTL